METSDGEKCVQNKNRFTNGFTKEITTSALIWADHISAVNLSNRNLMEIENNVKFPANLLDLDLSHNRLIEIPTAVTSLEKLRSLDVSYNGVKYFDETPKFCHTIEVVNLSHNSLLGPPYWVWIESPTKLTSLDLSFNINITNSFEHAYFEELLQYQTPVTDLKINNCNIKDHLKLLATFPKVKLLVLGSESLSHISINRVINLPSEGLENCCDMRSLNLSSTHLYNIKSNIDVFSGLVEINLSKNYIADLPKEFCNLSKLETCILSDNNILYLPDNINNLRLLKVLRVDNNELCMLPEKITELTNLECIDVYNNCLYEIPEEIKKVTEIDLAQNYFDEPEDTEYDIKKGKLRLSAIGRFDGRKNEAADIPDSEQSPDTSDDESYLRSISKNSDIEHRNDPPSSPEDWDSDDYWVPRFCGNSNQPLHSTWLYFVKRKMEEGNFCPMDAHPVSVAEKVRYEKLCNPVIQHESDGQFDDFSDDNS